MDTSRLVEAMQALRSALAREGDPIPDGWFTVSEFARANNVSYSHAGNLLRNACRAGIAECRSLRICTNGLVRRAHCYRLVDNADKKTRARPVSDRRP